MLIYKVIAQGIGGLRYGHKERAGIYLTDSAEDATGKEKALEELALIESKRVLKN